MKKNFKFLAMAVVAMAAVAFSACNADDDYFAEAQLDEATPETRVTPDGRNWFVVDFENIPANQMAGPTSYGDNLYSTYNNGSSDYVKFDNFTDFYTNTSGNKTDFLTYGINLSYGSYDFWSGGVVVSDWNYMSNIEGKTGDWWYSYQNQCSIYNTQSTDGANAAAGYGGSNRFGVVYGYSYTGFNGCAKMTLVDNMERTFDHLYVCNSSYAYGCIINGNGFTQGSLPASKGWFKLTVRGYKAGATSPVAEDEIYLADYRNGSNVCLTEWTLFDLTNIKKQKVNYIEFDFTGSDSGSYGVNTPAYVCIDNLYISRN